MGVEGKDLAEHWLEENLKTCRNLIDTSLLLIRFNNKHLLPTQLEFLFETVQKILDEHCTEKD